MARSSMAHLGLLVLVQTLRSVEGAKAPTKGAGLTLGDATLLVMDGVEDDGMKLARDLLAKEKTDVNIVVEMDDGAKGSPLAVAISSMTSPEGENCMALVHALLKHKDVDVNAVLIEEDGSTIPPLVLAANAVAAGLPVGVEIVKALLAHDKIAVNAMTAGSSTTLAALHLTLAAGARGVAAGLEIAGALLERSDVDVDAEMVGPDGVKMTPLMKLATMLEGQPTDSNILKAVALVRASGRAKPLADESLQRLVESAAAPKEEL